MAEYKSKLDVTMDTLSEALKVQGDIIRQVSDLNSMVFALSVKVEDLENKLNVDES